MPTSLISNTIKGHDGNPLPNIPVVIDLVPGPAFRINDGTEILPVVETQTDATGLWSVPLEQNTNIDPSTSYYRCKEYVPRVKGGQRVWYFLTPSVSPSKLHDCLYVPSVANSLIRPIVATSNNRPVNPYIGMQIFETDTGRVLYYYGSTLGWQPDWTQAWGELIGINSVSGDFSTSSNSYVLVPALSTASFQVFQGRKYVTVISLSVQIATAAQPMLIGLYDGGGVQLIERSVNYGSVPATAPVDIYYREGASSGLSTGIVSRRVQVAAGTGSTVTVQQTSAHPGIISVRDVGPRQAPNITP